MSIQEMIACAFYVAVFVAVLIVTLVVFCLIGTAIAFGISNVIEWIREKRWKHDENA